MSEITSEGLLERFKKLLHDYYEFGREEVVIDIDMDSHLP
jgi:hypothetical protein